MVQSGALFLHSPGRYLLVRHVLVTLLRKIIGHERKNKDHNEHKETYFTFHVTRSGCRTFPWTQSWMRSQSSSSL